MGLNKGNETIYYRVSAVLFDFDGTLTQPGAIDFSAIKKEIGCPECSPILEFIEEMGNEEDRQNALRIVDEFEMVSAELSLPNEDAEETVLLLKSLGIKIGIITRNGSRQVGRALENFDRLTLDHFDVIISRDDTVKPKPDREGVDLAIKSMDASSLETILVGDYLFDIQAGNAAGIVTVLLFEKNGENRMPVWGSDYQISRLGELITLMQSVLPISGGKLPNRFLDGYLKELDLADAKLLVKPGVGEDTAAVDIEDDEVLVLKSDPITFVTESLGTCALTINGNDIATSGAIPRWFLATLLFPPAATPAEILKVMNELKSVSHEMGISLCGGHTEITDAVTRPVISGTLIGTVSRSRLIDKSRINSGDRILLTKGVAVEGTAIIATEFENRLKALGMPDEEIEKCREFKNAISIIPEANLLMSFGKGIHALHDVTEGGLATALDELSRAGGHRFQIDLDKIPIFPQTRTICRMLDLDPMGLIGSGSLIICCEESLGEKVIKILTKENIEVHSIGRVLETGSGIEASRDGVKSEWPEFKADELTRLFSEKIPF
jgi:hydrogenase expression/formation protein HypE